MINVNNLTKRFGDFVAVNDLSFTLEKGEILGFLGPNGAGKSTTMKILTGYLPPTTGTVTIDDLDVTKHPIEIKRRIGYLPETPPLYNDMTVKSYLKFVSKLKGLPRNERQDRIDWVVDAFNLEEVYTRLIQNLSKGFRQRVGLAQSVVHNPRIVILDEPTIGLDPRQINEIRDVIKKLAENHTIIISTHILPEVTMLCRRVLIINRGQVIAQEELSSLTKEKSLEETFLELISKGEISNQSAANKIDSAEPEMPSEPTENSEEVTRDV